VLTMLEPSVCVTALSISALSISALSISALRISALSISALSISALRISGLSISALSISALSISALRISALSISALRISAFSISANFVVVIVLLAHLYYAAKVKRLQKEQDNEAARKYSKMSLTCGTIAVFCGIAMYIALIFSKSVYIHNFIA